MSNNKDLLKTDPTSFNDAIWDHHHVVKNVISSLHHLADSFDNTGNDRVATALDNISDALEISMKNLQSKYSESIQKEWNESQQNLANTLTLLIDRATR